MKGRHVQLLRTCGSAAVIFNHRRHHVPVHAQSISCGPKFTFRKSSCQADFSACLEYYLRVACSAVAPLDGLRRS